MEKGGTAGLLITVVLILVVTMGGGYYLFKADEPVARDGGPLVESPSEETPQAALSGAKGKVRATRSFVILDGGMVYTPFAVYYESGTDTDGEPLYTAVPSADPETFQVIGRAPPPPPPKPVTTFSQGYGQVFSGVAQGDPGESDIPYSITFYSDDESVYMVVATEGQTNAPQIVAGADPSTFQILSAEYSKDINHVYVVIVHCVLDTCAGTITIVAGADPATFQAFPTAQSVMNSDCTGYVIADSQDANHVFNNGQIVDGVSVYLIGENGECDDTPQLVSP
jgi:hypothetical protein